MPVDVIIHNLNVFTTIFKHKASKFYNKLQNKQQLLLESVER